MYTMMSDSVIHSMCVDFTCRLCGDLLTMAVHLLSLWRKREKKYNECWIKERARALMLHRVIKLDDHDNIPSMSGVFAYCPLSLFISPLSVSFLHYIHSFTHSMVASNFDWNRRSTLPHDTERVFTFTLCLDKIMYSYSKLECYFTFIQIHLPIIDVSININIPQPHDHHLYSTMLYISLYYIYNTQLNKVNCQLILFILRL